MDHNEALNLLEFFREAERLKNVYRTSYTSDGQPESPATHTWRVCLMAIVMESYFPEMDIARLLKLCVIHDLGEAIHGDIPAIQQTEGQSKSAQERADLLELTKSLPEGIQEEIVALWDEYEGAATPEAQLAKGLDKLETLLQHNQGANPPDFDYVFNIPYGKKFTDMVPLIAQLRAIVDEDTKQHAREKNGYEE